MTKLLALLLLAVSLLAQTHYFPICDQQATPNCITLTTPSVLTSSYTWTFPQQPTGNSVLTSNSLGVSVWNPLTVQSSGNVGIGTTSPATALEVQIPASPGPVRGILSTQYSNDRGSGMVGARKARGTPSSPAAIQNNDFAGSLIFGGFDGSAFQQSTAVTGLVNGTVSSGSVPTDLLFFTGSSGTGTERMRILSTGNVGIGTSGPGYLLDVNGQIHSASGGFVFPDSSVQTTAVSFGTQSANTFYAGPTSGSPAAPSFRTLAVNDFNSGTGASSSTFWRGDGTWAPPGANVVASYSATAQSASISNTALYTPAGAGMYRASCHLVLTQAAGTSSTFPDCTIQYTPNDTGSGSVNQILGITGNTANVTNLTNTFGVPTVSNETVFRPLVSSPIFFRTANYLSSGSPSMQYSIYVRLEYLGP